MKSEINRNKKSNFEQMKEQVKITQKITTTTIAKRLSNSLVLGFPPSFTKLLFIFVVVFSYSYVSVSTFKLSIHFSQSKKKKKKKER